MEKLLVRDEGLHSSRTSSSGDRSLTAYALSSAHVASQASCERQIETKSHKDFELFAQGQRCGLALWALYGRRKVKPGSTDVDVITQGLQGMRKCSQNECGPGGPFLQVLRQTCRIPRMRLLIHLRSSPGCAQILRQLRPTEDVFSVAGEPGMATGG